MLREGYFQQSSGDQLVFYPLKSLSSYIETAEFMHVYNAIIVLKEILPVFPLAAVCDAGPVIDTATEKGRTQ